MIQFVSKVLIKIHNVAGVNISDLWLIWVRNHSKIWKAIGPGIMSMRWGPDYEDGTFRADQTITRQEAMVMLERAMKIVKLDTDIQPEETGRLISKYSDSPNVSVWAQTAAAVSIRSGLIDGYDNQLFPTKNITRAETAAILYRLLIKSQLINEKR